jgi:hypothetical protein
VSSRAGAPVVGLLPGNFIVTEGHAAVGAPSLAVRNTGAKATDVALLVERSPAMETLRAEVQGAVADLYAQVAAPDRLAAVSAGERAVREAAFGETRLRFQQLALQAPVSSRWRFDLGARLAGDELVSSASGARRAIVFYTTGTLGGGAFGTYSALEIAAYLRNNDISLSAVLFGGAPVDEDLAWIAAATGGKVYRASSPEGIPAVAKDLRARTTSTYTLRYTSQSPAEFGERYIPVEVEVTSQKVSGRDESGYYAPAGYEPPSSKSSGSTSSGSSSSGGH